MSATAVVLFAHPSEENSTAGSGFADRVAQLSGVEVRRLYDLYPDFDVNIEREQAVWNAADVIVLQHPFYWYSCPALVKEYLDVVLEYGWAYGPTGTALQGKSLQTVITAGGPAESYEPAGYNQFSIQDLLRPFEATANLCRMRYEAPLVLHSANHLGPDEKEAFAAHYEERLLNLLARHDDTTGKAA